MARSFASAWIPGFTLVFLITACTSPSATDLTLPALFSDHMVLQQNEPIAVWGKAAPGGRVMVSLADQRATAAVEADSSWRLTLEPLMAGGPYEMTVAGWESITIRDVLVGEVWLASGQSNMQWAVQQSNDAAAEIAAADYPEIRLFSVDRVYSPAPMDAIPSTGWAVTTPETVAGFSAVAYFFGRTLHEELDVPIGLIHSSWGGTVAEAWTSSRALKTLPDFADVAAALEADPASFRTAEQLSREHYADTLRAWLAANLTERAGFGDGDALWAAPEYNASSWSTVQAPGPWEAAGLPDFDGFVWFRTSFDLPEDWADDDLILSLGPVDDVDITWVNGREVGSELAYTIERSYTVPASATQAGENVVAVLVLDTGGGGGLVGAPEAMFVARASDPATTRSLAGVWAMREAGALRDLPPLPPSPRGLQNTPTVLYNAMIAPLIPYGLNGAIWYQGESNAGRAYQYRTLFPTLIEDWRTRWGTPFTFLFVQLANFMDRQDQPVHAETWPELREAQTMALQLPNTGMAVTIDIGEADDIHPRNKQDVGHRLALAALHQTYNRDVVYAGPLYTSMEREGNGIRLTFDHVGSGLTTTGGEPPLGFAIAGPDSVFHWANVTIQHTTILVSSPAVPDPVAVRYSWADNPVGNLINEEGLPASPFRTDDWPGITER